MVSLDLFATGMFFAFGLVFSATCQPREPKLRHIMARLLLRAGQ